MNRVWYVATHDSLTGHIGHHATNNKITHVCSALGAAYTEAMSGAVQPFFKTQAMTVAEQLETGVRGLDLRAVYDPTLSKWVGRHGSAVTDVDVLGVLKDVGAFLERNPSEFAIVRLTHLGVFDPRANSIDPLAEGGPKTVQRMATDAIGRQRTVLVEKFMDEISPSEAAGKALLFVEGVNDSDYFEDSWHYGPNDDLVADTGPKVIDYVRWFNGRKAGGGGGSRKHTWASLIIQETAGSVARWDVVNPFASLWGSKTEREFDGIMANDRDANMPSVAFRFMSDPCLGVPFTRGIQVNAWGSEPSVIKWIEAANANDEEIRAARAKE